MDPLVDPLVVLGILIAVAAAVSATVLAWLAPKVSACLEVMCGDLRTTRLEVQNMRKLYADTAKTSAEAAATWAEVRRKMLRGESRGEGN